MGACRTQEDVEDVKREVQIMHHLAGHPHITKLKGAYEDRTSVHLVQPSCCCCYDSVSTTSTLNLPPPNAAQALI